MNRLFSQRQRQIILWASGGRCALCGDPLTKSFHADHVLAFSRGGKTITRNGQALCAPCNLNKSDK